MKKQVVLKRQQQDIPNHLFTKNKKTNTLIENQYYKSKISHQRNRLSNLLHDFQPGYMEPEYQGDQTLKVTQKQISNSVNIQNAANIFDLALNMGSYRSQYSMNGSTLMLTSSQGHIALMKWRQKQPIMQTNIKQSIFAGTFLYNDEMLCLCQSSNTFIYDQQGVELHKLDRSNGVQYLPYHFLLATYDQRKLRYYDITTGHIVADHIAKNNYTVMSQNRSNAIIALGSNKGVVEWWTPGIGTPAIKIFAGASLSDIAFYKGYMITASEDIKIWDSRMLKVLYNYPIHRRICSLEMSQSGLLCVNYGFKLQILKDSYNQKQTHPYMVYQSKGGVVNNTRFVNYEDVLGMGTSKGFSSILVPGSGSAYFDTFQSNPFETKKQKRESLVHKLLQKLPYETIVVDPNTIGNIDKTKTEVLEAEDKEEQNIKEKEEREKRQKKKKARGRNSVARRVDRKNIQMDKKRREQLTKVLNTKLWAKWAEKKKKQSQLDIIKSMQQEGITLSVLSKNKEKKIKKQL